MTKLTAVEMASGGRIIRLGRKDVTLRVQRIDPASGTILYAGSNGHNYIKTNGRLLRAYLTVEQKSNNW